MLQLNFCYAILKLGLWLFVKVPLSDFASCDHFLLQNNSDNLRNRRNPCVSFEIPRRPFQYLEPQLCEHDGFSAAVIERGYPWRFGLLLTALISRATCVSVAHCSALARCWRLQLLMLGRSVLGATSRRPITTTATSSIVTLFTRVVHSGYQVVHGRETLISMRMGGQPKISGVLIAASAPTLNSHARRLSRLARRCLSIFNLHDRSIILVDLAPRYFSDMLKIEGFSNVLPKISGVASNAQYINGTFDSTTGGFVAYLAVNTTMSTVAFTGTSAGVQNLTVRRADCTSDTQVYHPDFANHLSRCTVLRMMDYLETNNNPIERWDQRPTSAWPQWAWNNTGAPLEAVIALANEVGKDIWVNVPISADDEYVTNMAQLLFNTLNSSLNVYVEWSNEVWNWQFSQAHTALSMANQSVTQQGDPFNLNYDNCANQYYWQYRLTAYNAAVRLPVLFKSVFGAGNVGRDKRVRPVLASQIAYDVPLLEGINYLTNTTGPISSMLHSIAGAPYFGLGSNASNISKQGVDAILEGLVANINSSYLPDGWNQVHGIGEYATIASWHRVYVNGYEGGPDFSQPNLNYTFTADAQRDPRFAQVFQNYWLAWASHGPAGPINHFTAGATQWDAQYGNWGLLEYIDVPSTPKTQGFDAAANAPRPANALGLPPGTLGFPAGYYAGCTAANVSAAGSLSPNPWSGDDESYLYPLNLAGAAAGQTLTITLHCTSPTSGSAGVLEVGLNSDVSRYTTATIPAQPTSAVPVSFTLTSDDVTAFGGCSALRLKPATPSGISYTIVSLDVAVA